MLRLSDIRKYIAGIGIVSDGSVYIGKLDNKNEETIGVYARKAEGSPITALGGYGLSTYECKQVSLLIHWNRNKTASEEAAVNLFEELKKETNLSICDIPIRYIRLMVPEPQDVGTDDEGVCEYVIWLDFIYQKGG